MEFGRPRWLELLLERLKEPRVFSKRFWRRKCNDLGSNLEPWSGFISICGRKDGSKKYQNVLEDGLLPFLRRFPHLQFIYQQDNAAIHVSRSTKDWMELKNITTME